MSNTGGKGCSTCGLNKPLTEFHMQKGKRRASCKVCVRKEHAARYRRDVAKGPKRVELDRRVTALEVRVAGLENRFRLGPYK